MEPKIRAKVACPACELWAKVVKARQDISLSESEYQAILNKYDIPFSRSSYKVNDKCLLCKGTGEIEDWVELKDLLKQDSNDSHQLV